MAPSPAPFARCLVPPGYTQGFAPVPRGCSCTPAVSIVRGLAYRPPALRGCPIVSHFKAGKDAHTYISCHTVTVDCCSTCTNIAPPWSTQPRATLRSLCVTSKQQAAPRSIHRQQAAASRTRQEAAESSSGHRQTAASSSRFQQSAARGG